MELYQLNFAREERRYEGFALNLTTPSLLGRKNLLADIAPVIRTPGISSDEAISFRSIWKAPKVTGNVSPKHDSPGINLIHPAFSKRACECLAEFLTPSGEILPLETNVGEFYFFNITKIIDAVDRKNSVCTYFQDDPQRVMDIEEYAFHESAIKGTDIFRAYDLPINVIVTNQFLDKVLSSKLRGFSFTKMWPYPPGKKWRLSEEILT